MIDIFSEDGVQLMISRINALSADRSPQWGKMNASQMLAHCSVAYDLNLTDMYPKPRGLKKYLIRWLAKPLVVGPKPYPKNGRTAPMFIISDERDFDRERQRLIDNIRHVYEQGAAVFDGKDSHGFGALTVQEWNTLFSKHLDHHLTQFGV